MRYSQDRRFWARGAVKGLPLSCSAYRPYGQMRGLFWPSGRAPGRASDCASFPAAGGEHDESGDIDLCGAEMAYSYCSMSECMIVR